MNLIKTVTFYTLGCKVNQYETQLIREQFQNAGFQESENGRHASVCLINTCTVTHQADHSSVYFIRRAVRDNPGAEIIVTGCMTEFDSNRIAGIAGVKLIVRNKEKNRVVPLLLKNSQKFISDIMPRPGISYFKNHSRAFVKIQDGCKYKCSYCKVRLVRGSSQSRSPDEIKEEVSRLVNNGYREIVLSGICLGSYGQDLTPKSDLSKLLRELEESNGLFRIRLSSIEINDITDKLLNIMKESSKICPYLHIPLQSGDGQILKKMKRAYTPEKYLKIIERIRSLIPEIAITTDIMVGFPGETEAAFRNTVRLVKKIKPLQIHIFPYSKRQFTPAYNLDNSLPESSVRARAEILKRACRDARSLYCQGFISKSRNILIERRVEGFQEIWEGYTDNYIKVRVRSRIDLKNQIIQAKLKRIDTDFVLADIV